jgi:hypothetical protein
MKVIVGIWDEKGKLLGEMPFNVDKKRPCLAVGKIIVWLSDKIF